MQQSLQKLSNSSNSTTKCHYLWPITSFRCHCCAIQIFMYLFIFQQSANIFVHSFSNLSPGATKCNSFRNVGVTRTRLNIVNDRIILHKKQENCIIGNQRNTAFVKSSSSLLATLESSSVVSKGNNDDDDDNDTNKSGEDDINTKILDTNDDGDDIDIPISDNDILPTISLVPSLNTHNLVVANTALYENEDKLSNAENIKHQAGESTIINDSSSSSLYEIPSYRRLLLFCSTTFLIWLSEPLLSLVDTTVVGITQSNAVIQLASLGPATTLIDSLFYLTYFLAIATTNQIASQLAIKDYKSLQKTTSNVLGVAVILGSSVTIFVYLFANRILKNMAGLSGSIELLSFASKYVLIRASVAICSIMSMVMQAICLATFNVRTPSIAVLAASITNVIGDIVLRQYGVIGAAIATAVSTIVSFCILLQATLCKLKEWKIKEWEMKQQQKTTMILSSSLGNTIIQQKPNQRIKLISIPDRKSAIKLLLLSGPIFFVIVSKIICYSAMTIRCTNFGVSALAAHSIMMRIFFFFGCFGDSLSQTAQSFLPLTLYPKPNLSNFRTIIKRLILLAATIGFINRLCAINILKYLGQYITKDTVIVQLMSSNTHYIGLSILLHPFIVLLEGTVIASRDFTTLIKTYITTLPLHFTILKLFSGSFEKVWRTFFFFQITRLCLYSFRVYRKQYDIVQEEKRQLQQQQQQQQQSTVVVI